MGTTPHFFQPTFDPKKGWRVTVRKGTAGKLKVLSEAAFNARYRILSHAPGTEWVPCEKRKGR